jgi:hypothetical protein
MFSVKIYFKKSRDKLKLKFIDATETWPIEKKYPKDINAFNKMINTFLIDLFPKNVDIKSKPLVLVHSK